jgi:hypothetical protein
MNTNLSLFSFDVRSYSGRVQHDKVVNRVLSDDICHMGCRLLTTLAVVLAATAVLLLLLLWSLLLSGVEARLRGFIRFTLFGVGGA